MADETLVTPNYGTPSMLTVNPMIVGADNYNLSSEGTSWFSGAKDAFTLGAKGAALAGINSFINTGVEIGNFFGGDFQERNTYEQLLGSDTAAADYYANHREGVELAGFLAGSIIPGLTGLKAFQAAKAGIAGSRVAAAAGLFSAPRNALIDETISLISKGVPSINSTLRSNRYKAIALGFGDQALQAAAWETGVAATMSASPVLENADWKDIGVNILIGAGVGGAVGGLFDAFGAIGKFKSAQIAADFKDRPYEVFAKLGKGDYVPGDRIVAILDSLNKIPALPGTEGQTAKFLATRKTAIQEAKLALGKVSTDAQLSNGMFDVLLKLRDQNGVSIDELYERLAGLTKIERIGADAHIDSPIFYFKNGDVADIISNTPSSDDVKYAYRLRDQNTKPVIARFTSGTDSPDSIVYRTAKEAFDNGADVWIDSKLVVHTNPSSKTLQRVPRPGVADMKGDTGASLILDTTTGRISDTAYAIVGDLVPTDSIKLTAGDTALRIGDHATYGYTLAGGAKSTQVENYLEANGRYVWADQRGILKGDIISSADTAMLDTLLKTVNNTPADELAKKLDKVMIKDADGSLRPVNDFLPDLTAYVQEAKRDAFNELANMKGDKLAPNGLPVGKDLREIAARLNTTLEYLSNGMPRSATPQEFSPDAARLVHPQHTKLTYDIGEIETPDGMVARGMVPVLARIQRTKEQANNVFTNFIGKDESNFPEIDAYFSQQNANSFGAGASGFGSANSNYGNVGEMYEAIGAGTRLHSQTRIQKTLDTLAPNIQAVFTDGKQAAEYGIFENILRSTPEAYVMLPGSNYAVLQKAVTHVKIMQGKLVFMDSVKAVMPDGFLSKAAGELDTTGTAELLQNKGKFAAYRLSDDHTALRNTETTVNDERLYHHNMFLAANGFGKQIEQGRLYAKPIDTKKYNFFALVREPQGNGASSSSVASLTANTQADLDKLIQAAKGQNLEVFTKNDIKRYHQVLDDYDYNMNMVENTVDSTLKKEGILSNYFPEINPERLVDDITSWHRNQETRLTRNMVELKYAQQFAELRQLGEQYTALATSKFQNVSQYLANVAKNPYNDYVKTALDVSKKSEYRLWQDANEKVEAFFDTAFNTAKEMFSKAAKGESSWEEVNKQTQKFGLGNPYSTMGDYLMAQNSLPPTPHLRQFIAKANGILAATTLRLDFLNSLVNTISTPILLGAEVASIRRNLSDPKLVGQLTGLLTMETSGGQIPATTKLIYNAISNYFGPEKAALLQSYKDAGFIRDLLFQHNQMLDDLAFKGSETASQLNKRITSAVKLGETLTGNSFAEQFTRFVSADVMRQIGDAAGLSPEIKNAYIRTFVNRVQGNYIASQRPIVFQGVLGQAMGLFQTYQFNLMQQLFRHVENGDKKTVGTLLGLQGTLYGFQGLPLFSAVNTHIIGNASGNPTHTDAFAAIPRLVGKDLGDLLLYGGVSWASGAALYSRGDINPRHVTVIPINPLDWPAIDGTTRFVKNIYNMGQKLGDDGRFVTTMLNGLEHNSISRPLAGFAQVLQGYTTTSQGGVISRTQEVSNIANAARLLGAKPLNDAIALDAQYRSTAYLAKDRERIAQLGQAVKTALYNGGMPTDKELNEFATSYASSGGRIQNWNAFFVEQMGNANQSVVNKMALKLNNPISRNMMEIMGGEQLPDFTNASSAFAAPPVQ